MSVTSDQQNQISDPQMMDSKKSEGTQVGYNAIQYGGGGIKGTRRPANFSTIYAKSPHSQSLDQYTKNNRYEIQNGTYVNHRPKSKSIDYMENRTYSADMDNRSTNPRNK